MKQGVEFFLTRHIQVVSPGNADGVILPQLFKDAVRVDTKVQTFTPPPAKVPENGHDTLGEQRYEVQ